MSIYYLTNSPKLGHFTVLYKQLYLIDILLGEYHFNIALLDKLQKYIHSYLT